MDREATLSIIASTQYGVFRHDQARQVGLTNEEIAYRLEVARWVRLHDLAYRHAAAPRTWHGDLLAACWAGGIRAVASHRSAAELYDLAGGGRHLIEIVCPRWRRARHGGLVVHETKAYTPADITTVEAIPCTSVERTLLDLGAVKGRLTVLMAYDRAVKHGLTTWDDVHETLKRLARSGRPGVRTLRWALAQRDPGLPVPESEKETGLLSFLSERGYTGLVPQLVIRDDDGRFVARVDIGMPSYRVAIDYDSDLVHSTPVELAHDNDRRNRIIAVRWFPIVARASDLRNGGHLLLAALASVTRREVGSPTPKQSDQAIVGISSFATSEVVYQENM